MVDVTRRLRWPGKIESDLFLQREWLVTNGLGGYASGTIAGIPTRRYHGALIASLAAPHGRTLMLNRLCEQLRLPDGRAIPLCGEENGHDETDLSVANYIAEFRLETGLPVWRYEIDDLVIEKMVLMPYRHNTVYIVFRLLSGKAAILALKPAVHFRPHEGGLSEELPAPYKLSIDGDRYEILGPDYPALRIRLSGRNSAFVLDGGHYQSVFYRAEARRGYESRGVLWSPGVLTAELNRAEPVAVLAASTESWITLSALDPRVALSAEMERRNKLFAIAPPNAKRGAAAELVLAADQFIVIPAGRAEETARARAAGAEVRTVIAGYHWFTDWGRDTMIALEGLTLATGRYTEARWILQTFARYVRDGLIPNMFPEGEREGLYHTADATLWFFHALARYVAITGDRKTLVQLLPRLQEIVSHHLEGTRFGIGVDKRDGLLHQGAEGLQLTWMDAKVGDWVVTPRRGKAVEINALWYNALRLLAQWEAEENLADDGRLGEHAEAARLAFNRRFWYEQGGYLYDVVDGEGGDDKSCRPNQLFAFTLEYPILDEEKWQPVLDVVTRRLLSPVGLRSLAPGEPGYQPHYDGDLRTRDAAYHQGTVWAWLIGPLVDAWLRVNPDDLTGARGFLSACDAHLNDACIGSIGEIFDAEEPYTPRGCVAQAWSVAEALRGWLKTSSSTEEDSRLPAEARS